MAEKNKQAFPAQHQRPPGVEEKMEPEPLVKGEWYKGSEKLEGDHVRAFLATVVPSEVYHPAWDVWATANRSVNIWLSA